MAILHSYVSYYQRVNQRRLSSRIFFQPLTGRPELQGHTATARALQEGGTIDVESLQGGAPYLAKLVYNSHNYGLWYI